MTPPPLSIVYHITISHQQGVNHLTDRTEEELKSMLGFKPSPKARLAKIERSKLEGKDATAEMRRKLSVLPDEVDWRKHGAVNPPRNQGQCGTHLSLTYLYVCLT